MFSLVVYAFIRWKGNTVYLFIVVIYICTLGIFYVQACFMCLVQAACAQQRIPSNHT